MRKIVKYKVIEGCGLDEINEKVNCLIMCGWQPLGPAFKSGEIGAYRLCCAQTMVKYEKEK